MSERKFVSNVDQGDAASTRIVTGPGFEKSKQDAQEHLKLRYVAFSDEAGVFLGVSNDGTAKKGLWSLKDTGGLTTAPTYASRDEFERFLINLGLPATGTYRMVQVHADLDMNYASKAAISKALLPGW